MKIYFEKVDILYFFVALGLCGFATLADFLYVIIPSSTVQGGIGLAVLLGEILIIITSDARFRFSNVVLGILISTMSFFLLRNNGWETVKTLVYIISLFLVIVSQYTLRISWFFMQIAFWVYFFYAACTYFMFFNKSFYMNYVVNLFENSKNMLINLYNSGNMAGLTAHYSTNAMLISVGLIIVMCKYFTTRKQSTLYLVAFMVIALLMTGKRAHVLFSIISLYMTYYSSLLTDKKQNRGIYAIGVLLLVLGFLYIIVINVPSLSNSIVRLRELTAKEDTSVSTRLILWGAAIRLFLRNPVIGIGWKQFPEAAHIISRNFAELSYYDTHNIYLQLLCETGVIGFLVYVFWFVYNIFNIIRASKYATSNLYNEKERTMIRFSLAYQLFFLMYGISGNPIYETITFIPYFIACGIGLYYGRGCLLDMEEAEMENKV